MKHVQIVIGLLITLVALWLGAYGMSVFPASHWAGFPTFMTALLVFCGGLGVVLDGVGA